MATDSIRRRVQATTEDFSVTPLELFFDLVFVYALTQVTGLMAEDLSARGVVNGLIVLALVWWCWVGFSWLGNVIQADEGWTRAAFFAVMAAMFIAALAIPEASTIFRAGSTGLLFWRSVTALFVPSTCRSSSSRRPRAGMRPL